MATQTQIREALAKLQILKNGGDANSLLLMQLLQLFQNKIQTVKGDKGDPGDRGLPGITPRKGVDYFTEAELNQIAMEIVDRVRGSLRIPNDGYTPISGKDYPSNEQVQEFIKQMVATIKIPQPKNGITPQKGLDYFTAEEIDIFINQVKKGLKELSAAEIRDKLNSLEGEERLPASAIKDLPQAIKNNMPPAPIEISPRRGGSTLEVAGYGQDIRKIVFGSNITVQRLADGVISVNSSASSGSNGIAVESPSETADGVILIFTFAHNPVVVISGNQTFSNGKGITVAGSGPYTVTFEADQAPFTTPYSIYNS